ncbi:hypothetical protein F2Q68_00026587 [Brassica cretica]|uniref:Uncharacterized protein n=1 Tax=Brassica cretica TaxID=69181 RepID=A0A8S9IBA9_BRACR|nr:hypothetical protein F2Q68_00026587 [Brassica cretica]
MSEAFASVDDVESSLFEVGILRGRIPVRLWRAIGLEDEIFYAGYFGSSLASSFVANLAPRTLQVPSLSAFAASNIGLFFGQLLLFDPVEVFLLFRHWFIERGAFPSRSAFGSSWIFVSVLLSIIGDVAGIQVDMLDFIGLRVLSRRWRTL